VSNRLDLALIVFALAGSAAALYWKFGRAPVEVVYVVQSGDTLSRIATLYEVSVEELRDWNDIDGDLIEIGQEIVIANSGPPELVEEVATTGTAGGGWTGGAAAPPTAAPDDKRSPQLSMPTPEKCIPFDADPGEEGMVAPNGLSYPVVKAALDAVISEALYCPGTPSGAVSMSFSVTVGCDGMVANVVSNGNLSPSFMSCVADVIRHADFPAHDIEGGQTFTYPVNATF